MMTAVFRDNLGIFTFENVENIQWDGSKNVWSVMFEDYEVKEIEAELIEIQK